MILLFISILPVIVILCYIYYRDKYEKEPFLILLKAFVGGLLSAIVTILVLAFTLQYFPKSENIFLASFYESFLEAGIPEEFFKFVFLYWFIWKNKAFNERFDGIVYAVFVSLGFACLENIMYVFENGVAVGFVRAVLSVPAHAFFGVIMGFYFSYAKFEPSRKGEFILKCLAYSMLIHGLFDFLLLYASKNSTISIGLALIVFVVFFVFVFFMWKIGFKKIKALSEASVVQTVENTNTSEGV